MSRRHARIPSPVNRPKHRRRRRREPYQPPRVEFTEIAVNEALMGICKGGVGAGPYGPGCPGNCMGGGS